MSGTRDLCIMACVFCRDPLFWRWMHALDAEGNAAGRVTSTAVFGDAAAKAFILRACQIDSRNDLDTNPAAAERFHALVRAPFLTWKEAQC